MPCPNTEWTATVSITCPMCATRRALTLEEYRTLQQGKDTPVPAELLCCSPAHKTAYLARCQEALTHLPASYRLDAQLDYSARHHVRAGVIPFGMSDVLVKNQIKFDTTIDTTK